MSTNCFKTQLKGVVNNPNLPIFEGISFTFKPDAVGDSNSINSSAYSSFVFTNVTTLKLVGNCYFKDKNGQNAGKEVTLAGWVSGGQNDYVVIHYNDTNDVTLSIKPCYNISTENGTNSYNTFPGFKNISEIKGYDSLNYAEHVTRISFDYSTVQMSLEKALLNNTCTYFYARNTAIYGDVAIFGLNNNIREIVGDGSNFNGNIEDIVENLADENHQLADGASIKLRFSSCPNVKFMGSNSTPVEVGNNFNIVRDGDNIYVKQSDVVKGTYNITTGTWS